MQSQSIRPRASVSEDEDNRGLEMTIVGLLASGQEPVWFLDELQRELDEDPVCFADAIKSLQCSGVVRVSGELVKLSRTARRTDELEGGI
jgi:hypothetical protein